MKNAFIPLMPDLREKAEQIILARNNGRISYPTSNVEVLKMIHELEVHRIELELQNDELRYQRAREAELANEKYLYLYDFAPSGYITISQDGKIKELNMAGAKMLGQERPKLKEQLIDHFIGYEMIN